MLILMECVMVMITSGLIVVCAKAIDNNKTSKKDKQSMADVFVIHFGLGLSVLMLIVASAFIIKDILG